MKKKEKLIGAALLFVLALFIFAGVLQSRKPTKVSEEEIKELFSDGADLRTNSDSEETFGKKEALDSEEERLEKNSEIIVEIKGEVQKPDVYKLKEGSRINDLINMAGGLTENANLMSINRATLLSDGSCIIVGNLNDKEGANSIIVEGNEGSGNSSKESDSKKININKASKEELMTLTGIGEVKAESILSYRESKGAFKSIEELAKVDGIGIKTVEKLKEKITL
ncbi:MAG: helix-hairpin-helix domain-containing protein [Sarcina sp.]